MKLQEPAFVWASFKWQLNLGEFMAHPAHPLKVTTSERRGSPRYPLEADLEYRVLTPGLEAWPRLGHTVNMSRTGLLFNTADSLENGSPVELWIDWPARPVEVERWLRVWGWVVRQCDGSVAVAIRQYSFEQHRRR
jgi:hypothetical protein